MKKIMLKNTKRTKDKRNEERKRKKEKGVTKRLLM